MDQLIISVSGLRGIVGDTLTPEVAMRFAASFAAAIPDGTVVVGRDGRESGPMLASAIVSSLQASGRDVIDAGPAATPTIGVLVRARNAAGGIQISASHNPPAYNGIKLFGADGRVLNAVSGRQIRDGYFEGVSSYVSTDQLGSISVDPDPHQVHLDWVASTVDLDAIRRRNFRVLLDSNHGAGGRLGRRLLDHLGCDVEIIGEEPTGRFDHVPEPTADNLVEVAERVGRSQRDVGFCQDPDADRLALIDEQGRYIGEEMTLALCVRRAMQVGLTGGPIVINGATSSMSQAIASEYGVETIRTAVGEANVCDAMIDRRAVYGGEGNGGPIDPRVGYVRDSFVGMSQVLDLMASTGKSLSALADELPRFHIHKDKVGLGDLPLSSLLDQIADQFREAKVDRRDGLRLQWPDRWLLVRGSNTEPIVRMIAEAETMDIARQLCEQAKSLLTEHNSS
ncbi:MAG: phosphoglucosamine mutase [Planctomycetota bacterium]